MRESLENKFEILIENLKFLQYAREIDKPPAQLESYSAALISIAEELRTADITLRHQKEELLFAYQTLETGYQRYWEFFNFAPDGYLVTDSSGIIREANQTILSMLSAKPIDLLGKPVSDYIPEIQHDFGMQLSWLSGSQQLEVNIQPRGRTPFYASLSISPQCNIENQTIGLLWLIRDITERKKMEEALRKSKTELSMILEQTPYTFWITDAALKITSMSGSGLYPESPTGAEVIGLSIADYFGGKFNGIILKAHERALHGQAQTFDFEWQGKIFQCTVEALKDSADKIHGVIGAAFDVSDRKKAEKILQESENFNASLLQNSPNPIVVIKDDSSISYVNPAFEKLTGFPDHMVIGQKAPYPWWTNEAVNKSLESFYKNLGKKKSKSEKLLRKKNGEQFWAEITTILVKDGLEGDHHLQTWIDITEAKRLRENLEYYVMQITRVQEDERRRVAQELHEETVQSLAALCLATEAIIKSKEQNSEETIQDLNRLRDKINGVIEQVRHFSYGLRPGVLDWLGLTAALETLTDDLQGKGIKAELTVTGEEKPLSPDLEITLFRIMQEALSNVKKYSLAGQVTANLCYTKTRIRLSIADNGQGFKLPQSLGELANQGKLGLIGIKERSRLFGGTFSIRTQPKKGTKLTITLPISTKSN
jgi:PAS domain S-box-containing protein